MGIGLDARLDVFDYRAYSIDDVRTKFQQGPRVVNEESSFSEVEIIRSTWHRFFRLHRLRGIGPAHWRGQELLLLVIMQGSGELFGDGNPCSCIRGQTWLLPGAAPRWDWRPNT